MDQSRPLLVYFRPFLNTISKIHIENSVGGGWDLMVGTDDTKELWRPTSYHNYYLSSLMGER